MNQRILRIELICEIFGSLDVESNFDIDLFGELLNVGNFRSLFSSRFQIFSEEQFFLAVSYNLLGLSSISHYQQLES